VNWFEKRIRSIEEGRIIALGLSKWGRALRRCRNSGNKSRIREK
jgi:hypothetical protein